MGEGTHLNGESRRDALKKLGLGVAGAAAVWSTPAIVSVDAASAFTAQPIQFVSSSTNVNTASFTWSGIGTAPTQDVVVTVPSGLQEFDLLLAIVGTNGNSSISTVGSSWTNLSENTVLSGATTNRAVVFSRVATASEPVSFTFRRTATGLIAAGGPFRVLIVGYRYTTGVNAGGVANAPQGGGVIPSNPTTHTFPTVTGRRSGWAVRLALSGPGGAALWGAPTSPDVADANTGNVDRSLVVFHTPLAASPPLATVATGTTTLTIAPGRPSVAFTVAINSQFNP